MINKCQTVQSAMFSLPEGASSAWKRESFLPLPLAMIRGATEQHQGPGHGLHGYYEQINLARTRTITLHENSFKIMFELQLSMLYMC